MNTEQNWGAESWRQPATQEDDMVIFSEHGRSIDRTDYRSHWFKFVKARFGGYFLLVKHGGGEERLSLGYTTACGLLSLSAIDADARYLILWTLHQVAGDAYRRGREESSHRYQLAFLEGRLKRKKKNHRYYVEVLPQLIESEASHA